MKAQRFTVTIKAKREGAEQFTVQDIEDAVQRCFPNVMNEKHGTHTFTVKVAR